MAGDWIKMRCDIRDDPAVIHMADVLDVDDRDLIVGKLQRLWSWANRHSDDGTVKYVGSQWVDQYVELDGFADAMEAVDWLIVSDSQIEFPEYEKNNGPNAKQRMTDAERQRKSRSRHKNVTTMSHNGVTENCDTHGEVECDKSVTREEKRREENNICAKSDLARPCQDFDEFWKAYPKRGGRLRGKEKSRRLYDQVPADELPALLAATRNYAASREATGGFARDPEKFLRDRWWASWAEGPEPDPVAGQWEHVRAAAVCAAGKDHAGFDQAAAELTAAAAEVAKAIGWASLADAMNSTDQSRVKALEAEFARRLREAESG